MSSIFGNAPESCTIFSKFIHSSRPLGMNSGEVMDQKVKLGGDFNPDPERESSLFTLRVILWKST